MPCEHHADPAEVVSNWQRMRTLLVDAAAAVEVVKSVLLVGVRSGGWCSDSSMQGLCY